MVKDQKVTRESNFNSTRLQQEIRVLKYLVECQFTETGRVTENLNSRGRVIAHLSRLRIARCPETREVGLSEF